MLRQQHEGVKQKTHHLCDGHVLLSILLPIAGTVGPVYQNWEIVFLAWQR
jgi:hypothetical protein